MAEGTDQQLVDKVLSGNKNAFNLLVLRYQHRMVALIGRFIRDPQEVEDVCQEAERPAKLKLRSSASPLTCRMEIH